MDQLETIKLSAGGKQQKKSKWDFAFRWGGKCPAISSFLGQQILSRDLLSVNTFGGVYPASNPAENSPLDPKKESFYHEWMLDVGRCFYPASVEMTVWFLTFINRVCDIDFQNVKPTLHSWERSHLVMGYNPFSTLLDSVC